MKHPVMPTKTHSVAAAKHLNMMRQNLLYRGFMIESEKGVVCKHTNPSEDKNEEQR